MYPNVSEAEVSLPPSKDLAHVYHGALRRNILLHANEWSTSMMSSALALARPEAMMDQKRGKIILPDNALPDVILPEVILLDVC